MATKRVSDVQSSAEMASEKKQKQVRVWVDGWWVWLHWIEQSICFFFSDYAFARFLKMIVQLPCTLLSYSIIKIVFEIIFLCNTKCTQEHDENWFLAMIFNLFRCIFVIWIECPSNLVYRFLCFIHDCVLLDKWQQAGNSPASFFFNKDIFCFTIFCNPLLFFYSFDMVHFGHANAIRQVMYTSLSLSLSNEI